EPGAIQEAGDGDEADDAGVVLRVVVEHLPGGPAPEIDVQVAQVLGVGADAPISGRDPGVEQADPALGVTALFDPAAAALRLLLVGRIADHDGDRLLLFDLVGLPPGFGNLAVPGAERLDLGVRAAQ